MIRTAIKLVTCLVLGVASTYAAAGLACKVADWRWLEPEVSAIKSGDWYHTRRRTPGYDRYKSETTSVMFAGCFGPQLPPDDAYERPFEVYPEWRIRMPEDGGGRRNFQYQSYEAAGFPFRCFIAEGHNSRLGLDEREYSSYLDARGDWGFASVYSSSSGDFSAYIIFEVGPQYDFDKDGDGLIGFDLNMPIKPMAVPLAMNSTLYAGLWMFAVPAPFRLRRALRRRAGKCIKCKYDLAGIEPDQPCPECGRVDCD